jgi:hypothetical protein
LAGLKGSLGLLLANLQKGHLGINSGLLVCGAGAASSQQKNSKG